MGRGVRSGFANKAPCPAYRSEDAGKSSKTARPSARIDSDSSSLPFGSRQSQNPAHANNFMGPDPKCKISFLRLNDVGDPNLSMIRRRKSAPTNVHDSGRKVSIGFPTASCLTVDAAHTYFEGIAIDRKDPLRREIPIYEMPREQLVWARTVTAQALIEEVLRIHQSAICRGKLPTDALAS
jgi:hypothetical protein